MAISKQDSEKMRQLAKEGKQISKIVKEDFHHQYEYWDVYLEIYGSGEKSSRGIKTMISNRLIKLIDSNKEERRNIVDELQGLVWHLYENHKANQVKLDKIRKALSE